MTYDKNPNKNDRFDNNTTTEKHNNNIMDPCSVEMDGGSINNDNKEETTTTTATISTTTKTVSLSPLTTPSGSSTRGTTTTNTPESSSTPPSPPPPMDMSSNINNNSSKYTNNNISSSSNHNNKNNHRKHDRILVYEHLEAFNFLVHPVWIFDYVEKRMRWANLVALELWDASTLEELQQRNFHDVSEATSKRMEEYQLLFEQGQHNFPEQYTMYPKGVAKTVHMNVCGVRLSCSITTSSNNNYDENNNNMRNTSSTTTTATPTSTTKTTTAHDNHNEKRRGVSSSVSRIDDHYSIFCEGIPLVLQQDLLDQNVRSLELLRHLPMAVCQFDMQGNVIFQNPAAASMVPLLSSSSSLHHHSSTSIPSSSMSSSSVSSVSSNTNNPNQMDQEKDNNNNNGDYDDNDDGEEDKDDHHKDNQDWKDGNKIQQRTFDHKYDEDDNENEKIQHPTHQMNRSDRNTDTKPSEHQNNNVHHNMDDKTTTATTTTTTTETNHQRSNHSNSSTTTNKNKNNHSSNNSSSNHDDDESHSSMTTRGSLLHRFFDQTLAKQVLEDLQTNAKHNYDVQTDDMHKIIHLEAYLHTRDGPPKWSAIQLQVCKDPITGQPVILFSAKDHSDARIAQKEKEARERKSEFLAIMAHEIRTPLHQVTGFIDLLDETRSSLTKEQQSYVKLLKSSAQGLMTVISDVLDYSKLEAGKMKLECIPYEPKSVVEGSLAAIRGSCEEKQLELSLQEWHKDIPFRIMGDPNRLRQVLLNLLSNSVKFTNTGGIYVSASYVVNDDDVNVDDDNDDSATMKHTTHTDDCKENDSHHVYDYDDGKNRHLHSTGAARRKSFTKKSKSKWKNRTKPMVKFVVQDTGVGIEKEHLLYIFNDYYQGNVSVARTHGGTGLGLSICKLLVTRMGGTIGVESEYGKGSSFWFCLPARIPMECSLSNDDLTEDTTSIVKTTEQSQKLNVLIAEDNKVNQKLLKRMLERMGHTADIAENGMEAIQKIEAHKHNDIAATGDDNNYHGHYDVILMDIQMPVIDGLEATRRLRSMGYASLPIYGLTASVGRPDYAELGFDAWLPKPIPMRDLKAKLAALKQRHQKIS